ncbi:hypothetical protein ACPEIF_22030 [Streptomyces sp. NPDC012600]|uniref:hypothetical protein n=1 Tax=Streptomyces sp. NPDC012600 TaxID=3415005 RepID=UPI003C2E2ADF
MPSFATHRQRVHDTVRSPRARHAALRTCVVGFAVYGFRATYHHLCRSARIPALLESDPEALVRAVEELHEARALWLEHESAYVARRRGEKALGGRGVPQVGPDRIRHRGPAPGQAQTRGPVPDRAHTLGPAQTPVPSQPPVPAPTPVSAPGRLQARGPEGSLAYCPDPARHPTEPLPVVVGRLLNPLAAAGVRGSGCPACGHDAAPTRWRTAWRIHRLCAACGTELASERADFSRAVAEAREEQWRRIWSREE